MFSGSWLTHAFLSSKISSKRSLYHCNKLFSSTGISHHNLLLHIYSGLFPTVNSRSCPEIGPQSLHSSSQPLPSRGLASLSGVRMTVTRIVSFSFGSLQLFVTPWTAAQQASLSIANSRSLLKLTSTECCCC